MITLLVGHRGVGKTELVKRLMSYCRDQLIDFYDVDDQVETKIGSTIPELFINHGEKYFREIEKQVFLELIQSAQRTTYLVAGAGLDLSIVPSHVKILWIKRKTDLDGRIFLDRPRLNPGMNPLEEYRRRSVEREEMYATKAHETYLMPEGVFEHKLKAQQIEKQILLHQVTNWHASITVTSDYLKDPIAWTGFLDQFRGKSIDYFELRDDLLSPEQLEICFRDLAVDRILFSFRSSDRLAERLSDVEKHFAFLPQVSLVDIPVELGITESLLKIVPLTQVMISCHGSQLDYLKPWQDKDVHLKWSPECHTWQEIIDGLAWQQVDPQRRSFLPRSADGRWYWVRLWLKQRQKINFIRTGAGSAADQPSCFEWLTTGACPQEFAAVLGQPVLHSYSPLEHYDYFEKRDAVMWAITVGQAEFDQAMKFLESIGLKWAAVTAPLKEIAGQWVELGEPCNTLYFHEKGQEWVGTTTDQAGFLELIEGIGMVSPLQAEIAIWGGGGVLPMIKKSLPRASYFSARTAQRRDGDEGGDAESYFPKVLVWAAPNKGDLLMPPDAWQPRMVLDLNYKEDSPGRTYALRVGATYVSGLKMFVAQAQQQRLFWSQMEKS